MAFDDGDQPIEREKCGENYGMKKTVKSAHVRIIMERD
jgi:hypothetical protein